MLRSLFSTETPARLRLWTGLVLTVASVVLLSLALGMARAQDRVRIIGAEATPRAIAAADLYFALSDLDAQVTRILLAGDADDLAGSRVDALGRYRERNRQVDADLRTLTTGGGWMVTDLQDGLAVYRQRVGEALTTDDRGYYTQATNLLHQRLLPVAQRLLDAEVARVDGAGRQSRTPLLVLAATLPALLIAQQWWMARRFRRVVNPALAAATGLSLLLTVAAGVALGVQERRLDEARQASLAPYLELSRLRAIGYDASADTSRYLISANLAYYREDFAAKSARLTAGLRGESLERWQAYHRGHERIVALAGDGRRAEAVSALTGIKRGEAAFDFAYFDASLGAATATHERELDRTLRSAELALTGWVVLPLAALGVIVILVLLGVRRRLAEYR